MNVNLIICPSTGGEYRLSVDLRENVNDLRRSVASKFRLDAERIRLIYNDRNLTKGTLEENDVVENSKIVLLPCLRSGLVVSICIIHAV